MAPMHMQKIYEFFLREKSAKRGFMKSSSHSSTASGIDEQIKIFDRAKLKIKGAA
jgi:hypothetical protein